jgi:hypothetical protein
LSVFALLPAIHTHGAHVTSASVALIYNRYSFATEYREAIEPWQNRLATLLANGNPTPSPRGLIGGL